MRIKCDFNDMSAMTERVCERWGDRECVSDGVGSYSDSRPVESMVAHANSCMTASKLVSGICKLVHQQNCVTTSKALHSGGARGPLSPL